MTASFHDAMEWLERVIHLLDDRMQDLSSALNQVGSVSRDFR